MSTRQIHPTAIVAPGARIGDEVTIGPYTVIDDDVTIGAGCIIRNSVYIANGARIGDECKIFSGAVIGTEPQDLKFSGEDSLAIIGDRSIIREYATVNRGTKASGKTVVGADCLIMAYCHVAHDCVLGDHVIMANCSELAGHVNIGDWAILGGGTLVHQFCNIGSHSMIGAGSYINKDLCHYLLAEGNQLKVYGLNKVGLRRRGFSADVIRTIEEFYNAIFHSGLNVSDGLTSYLQREDPIAEVQDCVEFIRASRRGIYRASK